MVLEIGKLENVGGEWMIVDPDGRNEPLASELMCATVYIVHEGCWEEVYCGEVVMWQGDIMRHDYQGPAIIINCGDNTNALAVPEASVGKWYAVHWREREVYWPLMPGMMIRTPPCNDHVPGTYQLEPRGKCVASVLREVDFGPYAQLGRLALDLAHMPFSKEFWFHDGEDFQESELTLRYDGDEQMLSLRLLGETDIHALFWLC